MIEIVWTVFEIDFNKRGTETNQWQEGLPVETKDIHSSEKGTKQY